jgi:hypothetical protein
VELTGAGRKLLKDGGRHLARRLEQVVERSGIPSGAFIGHARRLSAALDEAAV